MDVTKVPLSTARGTDSISKSTSVVEVGLDMKNRKKRLHKLNFGTSASVEDRIGYPTMNVQNNNNTATKLSKKATTKPGGKTNSEKANKTKQATNAPVGKQTQRTRGGREWGENISEIMARHKAVVGSDRHQQARGMVF